MKRILGIVILVFLIGTAGFSAETNKEKMIKELLSVTKLDDTASKLADELLSGLLKNNSNITEKQQMAFAEEMQNFLNYILEKQAFLYNENYSEKEIKEILAFYKTPTGKKLIERTPVIQKSWLDDVSANYIPGMADRLEKILTN